MATTRFIDIKIRSKKAERNVANLDRKMTGLGKTADGVEKSFGKLSAVATAIFSSLAINKVVKYADAFTSLQNQLRQTTKTTEQLNQRTQDLLDISTRARTEIGSTTELYVQLTLATEELNLTTEEQLRLTETIAKSFAVSGKSAAESAGAIRQLGQAFASGALRGDEFNSIAEGAPEIMRALQRETKKTAGELRAFAATGGITAELLVKSLGSAADVIDKKMGKAVKTFAQSAQEANNNLTVFIGSSTTIQNVMGGAGDAIVKASNSIDDIGKAAALAAVAYSTKFIPAAQASAIAALASAKSSSIDTAAKVAAAKAVKALAVEEVAALAVSVTQERQDLVSAIAIKEKAVQSVISAKATQSSAAATLELASANVVAAKTEAQRVGNSAALTAATAELAVAQKAASLATKEVIAAEVAASASAASLATAKAASSKIILQSAAAKKASSIASAQLVASNKVLTLSTRVAATATRGLTAALALIGGPIGAALIAATAIFLFIDAAESAEDKASRLAGEVDGLAASFKNLNDVQRGIEVDKLNTEMDALRKQLIATNTQLNFVNDSPFFKGKSAVVNQLESDVSDLNDQLDVLSVKQQAIFAGGLPELTQTTPDKDTDTQKESTFVSRLVAETEQLRFQLGLRQAVRDEMLSEEEASELDRLNRKLLSQQVTFEAELIKLGEDEIAKEELRAILREAQQLAVAEHESILTDIQAEASEERTEKEEKEAELRQLIRGRDINNAQSFAITGLSVLKQFGSDSFKTQKTFAIAESLVNITAGVAKALNNPYPANLGFAAQVALQGAGLISTIKSTNPNGGGSSPSISASAPSAGSTTSPTSETVQQNRFVDIRLDDDALLTGAAVKLLLQNVIQSDDDITLQITANQDELARLGAI